MGIVLHQFTVITSKTTRFEHFAPPPLFALSLSTSVSTNFFEPTSYLLFVSIFQSISLPVSSRNDQGYTWVSPFCGYPCFRYISDDTLHLIHSHNDNKPMGCIALKSPDLQRAYRCMNCPRFVLSSMHACFDYIIMLLES